MTNGYFPIETRIADKLCSYSLNGEESRVIWVIMRKTFGWGKQSDFISKSQFSLLTGISIRNVTRVVHLLVAKRVILEATSIKRTTKKYCINEHLEQWQNSKTVYPLSNLTQETVKYKLIRGVIKTDGGG